MIRWCYNYVMMIVWWCYNDLMMIAWCCMMMVWWWLDDGILLVWWWYDDGRMMVWWWYNVGMMVVWRCYDDWPSTLDRLLNIWLFYGPKGLPVRRSVQMSWLDRGAWRDPQTEMPKHQRLHNIYKTRSQHQIIKQARKLQATLDGCKPTYRLTDRDEV